MKRLLIIALVAAIGISIASGFLIYVVVSNRAAARANDAAQSQKGPQFGPRIEIRDIKIQLPKGAKILSHTRDTSDGENLADDVWLAEVPGTEAETDSHFRKILRADGWEPYDLLTEPRSKLTAWSKAGLTTKTVVGIQHTGPGSLEIRVSPVF